MVLSKWRRHVGMLTVMLTTIYPGAALTVPETLSEARKKGSELYRSAQYEEAVDYYERALELARQEYGDAHLQVVVALDHLANTYSALGRYAEAEPLFKRRMLSRSQAHIFQTGQMARALGSAERTNARRRGTGLGRHVDRDVHSKSVGYVYQAV